MSGGHYDYAFGRVRDLADEIYRDVEKLSVSRTNDWGETLEPPPEAVLDAMRRCAAALEVVAEAARDVEWYMSGDHGDETLVNIAKAWRIPELSRAATGDEP